MTTHTPRTPKIPQARASHTMTRRGLFVGVVALLTTALLALAACGDDGGPAATPTATPLAASPTAPESRATPAATAPEPTEAPAFEGGRDPVEVPGGAAPPVPILTDVRAAAHEGYDRIVFEFEGGLPGYRVEYVEQPIHCGTGLGAEVAGVAYLQVRMTPADAHDEAGAPTFGLQEISPSLPAIVQAVQTCDFEADVTWVIGLNAAADFRVADLDGPFRVVVDVAHP